MFIHLLFYLYGRTQDQSSSKTTHTHNIFFTVIPPNKQTPTPSIQPKTIKHYLWVPLNIGTHKQQMHECHKEKYQVHINVFSTQILRLRVVVVCMRRRIKHYIVTVTAKTLVYFMCLEIFLYALCLNYTYMYGKIAMWRKSVKTTKQGKTFTSICTSRTKKIVFQFSSSSLYYYNMLEKLLLHENMLKMFVVSATTAEFKFSSWLSQTCACLRKDFK